MLILFALGSAEILWVYATICSHSPLHACIICDWIRRVICKILSVVI